jgi:hypothetical protein
MMDRESAMFPNKGDDQKTCLVKREAFPALPVGIREVAQWDTCFLADYLYLPLPGRRMV